MSSQSRGDASWRPTASISNLRRRAEILGTIRDFFSRRAVLEVETPSLSRATVTDPHLASPRCSLQVQGETRVFYLQTSPEFAMKRLLAAGSGPIFQICRSFRDDEQGRRHNPEFTMLEWYRPGFDHHLLMDEMDELLAAVLATGAAARHTYGELFQEHLDLDAHAADLNALRRTGQKLGIELGGEAESQGLDRDDWLQLLFSYGIEPKLGFDRPAFVFDYPASQAALARVRSGPPAVAERFEVYVKGLELANGFHELSDAVEQRRRFEQDLDQRRRLGRFEPPIDDHLLEALADGFPDCAGVALGVDRLVMLALEADHIDEVLAFPVDRA